MLAISMDTVIKWLLGGVNFLNLYLYLPKETYFCPYLVSYLIQTGILIVALFSLFYQIYKGKKK